MEQIYIGEIIRETRIRLGYTQEDLCIGDLDITTISRIENGQHIPQNSVIKKIFAQMNLRLPIVFILVEDEEFKRYQLQSEIEERLKINSNCFDSLAEEFKNCDIEMDEFDWQIYYLVNGISKKARNDYLEAKNYFTMALQKTIKNFSDLYDLSKQNTYTGKELHCLYEIADTEFKIGNLDISEKYLTFLDNYSIHGIMNEDDRFSRRTQVLLLLCILNKQKKNYNECIYYCDEGINYCIKYDSLFHLSDFYYFKAQALSYLNNYEEAKKNYLLCFIILKHLGKVDELDEKKQEIHSVFNLETNSIC